MSDIQPSGQTVRGILEPLRLKVNAYRDALADQGHSNTALIIGGVNADITKAEAAINAHIVSVLEELKSKQRHLIYRRYKGDVEQGNHFVSVLLIDAAIAKYKQGKEES